MLKISGIAASAGIAIARAFILEHPNYAVERRAVGDVEAEIARLDAALAQSQTELESIKEKTLKELGEKKAEIFASHLLILNDPELIDPVKAKIRDEQLNADYALNEVATQFISMFENMKSAYLQERASDMRDVTKRILNHLLGVHFVSPAEIAEETIVLAEDLTPSDTAQLNREFVKGFATNIGGRTSHSAIMARSLEIPAVVGTKNILSQAKSGDLIIVDGLDGHVFVNPTEEIVAEYRAKQVAYDKQREEWRKLRGEATVSVDGVHVELAYQYWYA